MDDLYSQLKKEYEAPFSGWDFSYLDNRWIVENPPWDYKDIARKLVEKSKALLDMSTGGGEFLATLAPFPDHTMATESWAPNISVARAKLEHIGVQVVEVGDEEDTPFNDEEFDTVINRHSSFDSAEIFRILKPGGTFMTQQVGGDNLWDFAKEFDAPLPYPEETYDHHRQEIQDAGFKLITAEEWRGNQEFMDVGAIVYFVKAIPWTAPDFNIDKNMHHLEKLQRKLDTGEKLVFTQVRFLFQAEKPC